MTSFEVVPIGVVRSTRAEVVDDGWDAEQVRIELDQAVVEPSATAALESFSHVEVIFLFDRVDPHHVCRSARHPRGRQDWPEVGILAQRAKDRPNRLGTTTCELLDSGPGWLEVRGLDAVDGTPVIDVKPYMPAFGARGEVHQPDWAEELMSGYW